MKHRNALALLSMLCGAAQASPTCTLEVASLLSQGNVFAAAARFDGGISNSVQKQVSTITTAAGALSNLSLADRPLFAKSTRVSAVVPGLPDRYAYDGAWVNARSSKLGAVQLHMAIKPGSDCTVLAIHLDRPLSN